MSESLETPEAPEAPEGAPVPENPENPENPEPAAAVDAPPAEKPVRRGRIAAVAGVGVLLAAVVGGVGFTVVTVQGADRDAGGPVWHLPKTKDAEAKTAAPSGLAGMLVPYDGHWTPGPDIAQFGSDRQLSGAEATALRKESLRDLPRTQRKRVEKLIDKEHIKGMAMRSYLLGNSRYSDDHSSAVSIVLSQLEDQADVKAASTFQSGFLDALGVFRKGPAIKGFKNAKCFLRPKDAGEKLDAMMCSAYQGDVLVTVNASGPKPMGTGAIAKLLEEQLHRIKEPGRSV
ncbi:hypothetical protein [Streptomyces sp. YIM S03343]